MRPSNFRNTGMTTTRYGRMVPQINAPLGQPHKRHASELRSSPIVSNLSTFYVGNLAIGKIWE